jgi:hypothetical protein
MVIAGITDGYNKKFGVVSYVIVGGSGGVLPQKHFIFSTPRSGLHFVRILKQIFVYNVTLYCR